LGWITPSSNNSWIIFSISFFEQKYDDKSAHLEEDFPILKEWNDHGHYRRGKAIGSLENNVMLGKDKLQVRVHRGSLNCLNGMELGNDARMTFFQ
jgi:hypothetical protein